MNNKARFALLLASAWLGVAGPQGFAAQLVPLGPEILIYTDNDGYYPNRPSIAAQPDGSYLVAWDDETATIFDDALPYTYVAAGREPSEQQWSAIAGLPEDAPFPSVIAVTAAQKGFDVLLWSWSGTRETFHRSHLNLQGVPVGKPVRLGGPGTQWVWHVRGNGFMAGRTLPREHGFAARRLASTGQLTGPELRLNSRPVDGPYPIVLGLAGGGFLAVWQGVVPGRATVALRARRFSPAGKPLGPDFDVTPNPLKLGDPNFYHYFTVAAAPGGGFAVAWVSYPTLYVRFFNAAGTALGPEIPVATFEYSDEGPESMAFDNAGNLLLLWGLAFDYLRLQLFDPRGTRLGQPVNVNSEASGDYQAPESGNVAWAKDSWVVTWVAEVPRYEWGTIFVRRFAKR